jgi:hypothetical protein
MQVMVILKVEDMLKTVAPQLQGSVSLHLAEIEIVH